MIAGRGSFGYLSEMELIAIIVPTAMPGTMSITPTPMINQDEDDGQVQVGFNIGMQDFAQQGTGLLAQTEHDVSLKITVLQASGTIQQISIREGKCKN